MNNNKTWQMESRFLSGKLKTILFSFVFCLLFSGICEAQWVQVGLGSRNIGSLAHNGNNIFAGTSFFPYFYNLYLSTDNGTSWAQTSLTQLVYALAVSGNNIFAGTEGAGVFISTNNGTNWTQTPLTQTVYSLVVNGNYIFAGSTYYYGVYLSTDNGTSWIQTSLNNRTVLSLAATGSNIFAGTTSYGVYLSTDNGTTWTQTSLNNRYVTALAVNGNVFAGTDWGYPYGVYKSTDNGIIWTQTSLNNQEVNALAVNGSNIFAGTWNNGVYVSNDNGANWTQRNEGLPNSPTINVFCILNNYIFAGTASYGVYRRPLSELVSIQPISEQFPDHYTLEQNYPNPFNSSTKFEVRSSKLTYAEVKVFDLTGKLVTMLLNQKLNAGEYEITFDGKDLPSGIYFYSLLVGGNLIDTKKMVLIK